MEPGIFLQQRLVRLGSCTEPAAPLSFRCTVYAVQKIKK